MHDTLSLISTATVQTRVSLLPMYLSGHWYSQSLSHSGGKNRSVFLNTKLFHKDFGGFSEGDFNAGTREILVLISRGVAMLISGDFPQPRRLRWWKADFYGNSNREFSDRN